MTGSRTKPFFMLHYSCPKDRGKGGDCSMKRLCVKYAHVLAALALLVTTVISNTTCCFIMHQEPLPENAKKLRKF